MVAPVPIENGTQVGILVASSTSIFIAAFFVGLRLLSKHINSGFDYSDYCMVAALVSLSYSPLSYGRSINLGPSCATPGFTLVVWC